MSQCTGRHRQRKLGRKRDDQLFHSRENSHIVSNLVLVVNRFAINQPGQELFIERLSMLSVGGGEGPPVIETEVAGVVISLSQFDAFLG